MRREMNGCGRVLAGIFLAIASLSLLGRPAMSAELIMVEQQGCHWCQRWHAEVGVAYPKTAEGRRAPLRRIDITETARAGVAFASALTVSPTFVLIDDGREIGRITGYPGADFFWGLFAELLQRLPLETPKPELFKTKVPQSSAPLDLRSTERRSGLISGGAAT